MTLVNLEHEAPLPLLMHILIATVQIKVDKTFTCLTGKKTTRSGVREICARHHGSPIEGPPKTLPISLHYGFEGFEVEPLLGPIMSRGTSHLGCRVKLFQSGTQRNWFLFPYKNKDTSTGLETNSTPSGSKQIWNMLIQADQAKSSEEHNLTSLRVLWF